MENTNYKLQKFIEAVNSDIDEKVSDMLKEAEEEKARIIENARSESISTADSHTLNAQRKSDNKFVRELSVAELNMKKDILRHREELSDKVFSAVKSKLMSFRETSGYPEKLKAILVDLKISVGAEVRLAPEDMKYADALKAVCGTANPVFKSDEAIKAGGLSVYDKEKGTIIDKTYDLALEEQRHAFVGSNAFAE